MNVRSIAPRSISRCAIPYSSVRSDLGRIGRCSVAAIAVSVRRGSMTMISGECAIPRHPFPQHRVRDARIRTDQDNAVRFLEILIGVRRRVEAERLLVSHGRRRHALAGVAVAVNHPHAELGNRSQKRHLLGRDLTRAQKRDRVGAVLCLDGLEPCGHRRHRVVPTDRVGLAVRAPQQWSRRAVGRIENGQGLPAFGAGHPTVHRVIGRRAQVDRLTVA